MRKSFTRFLTLVVLIVVSFVTFGSANELQNSSNSPPLTTMLVMNESLPVVMLNIENTNQTWLAPNAITEVLYIKKDFSFCSNLQNTNMQLSVFSNDLMKSYATSKPQLAQNQKKLVSANPTLEGLAIKKDLTNFSSVNSFGASKRYTSCTASQSFQLSTMEGLCINEKVNSFKVNFTGDIA